MRIEQITAKALKQMDGDRYVLCTAIFERTKELSKGAKPLVDMDVKKNKFTDIALMEISQGLIKVESIENI